MCVFIKRAESLLCGRQNTPVISAVLLFCMFLIGLVSINVDGCRGNGKFSIRDYNVDQFIDRRARLGDASM